MFMTIEDKSKILSWGGLLASFVTIFLTGWNYNLNNKVSENVQRLNEAKFEVERLRFVNDVLTNISEKKEDEYAITINLVKLTLGKEKAKELFEGLSISGDKALSSLGREGVSSIRLEEYQVLIDDINDPNQSTRLKSFDELVKRYSSYSPAITRTLEFFSKDRINFLSADGRVNALLFLIKTNNDAWNLDQVKMAEDAIQLMKERHASGVATIGNTTRERIAKLEEKLNEIMNISSK